MISDDKLRAFVDITASDVEKDEFASSSIRHTFLHALCKELLAYREAERKANSWENAPEWANWFARDVGWFYQCKPQPGDSGEWENLAGVAEPAMHDGWETSLQERPK